MNLTYTKSNGKTVNVIPTPHAYGRFLERWERLRGVKLKPSDLVNQFSECFKRSKRVFDDSRKAKIRSKRYSGFGDSLYFKCDGFTFVVSDARIWTVEISDKNKRHLN